MGIGHRAAADDRPRRQIAGACCLDDEIGKIEMHADAGIGLAIERTIHLDANGQVQAVVHPRGA